MVQRRELASGKGGCGEARPVGDHQAEPIGYGGDVLPDQDALAGGRVERNHLADELLATRSLVNVA